MKTLTSVLAVLVLSAGYAAAQDLSQETSHVRPVTSSPATAHDLTGFEAPNTPGPDVTSATIKTPPNPHVVLKPKLGGIFVDGAKYGTIMISPGAPASYGMGEKYLSAPSSNWDLQGESGPAAHRDTGGMKLFTIEF
jgi:hypothetical protein